MWETEVKHTLPLPLMKGLSYPRQQEGFNFKTQDRYRSRINLVLWKMDSTVFFFSVHHRLLKNSSIHKRLADTVQASWASVEDKNFSL